MYTRTHTSEHEPVCRGALLGAEPVSLPRFRGRETLTHSPSTSSSGRMTGLRKERTSGIVHSPLYMNLVVTARTGISARGNQQLCRDLHIVQLSGGAAVAAAAETDPLAVPTRGILKNSAGAK